MFSHLPYCSVIGWQAVAFNRTSCRDIFLVMMRERRELAFIVGFLFGTLFMFCEIVASRFEKMYLRFKLLLILSLSIETMEIFQWWFIEI